MIDPTSIDITGAPFDGKKKLINSVLVEFRTEFIKHPCDAQKLKLSIGDEVIVETKRGPTIGMVKSAPSRSVVSVDNPLMILRRANDSDIEIARRNEDLERTAYKFAIDRIRTRNLDMKLVRVQSMHDGSKLVFYFSADGRIDFRDLVKDLAHNYRTRIEMFQIGVRDGSRMMGGIGSCGRELCCSTFLTNFAPVSIRMAKDQGLSLNPTKVSGQCGRLMCCLVYEQQIYRRLKRRLPRAKQTVYLESGPATVLDVDVIGKKLTVRLADESRKVVALEDVSLEEVKEKRPPTHSEYLWDGVPDDAPKKKKKRRRRRKKKKPEDGASANQPKQADKKEAPKGETTKPKKKRRRRRRKKKKPSGDGGDKK